MRRPLNHGFLVADDVDRWGTSTLPLGETVHVCRSDDERGADEELGRGLAWGRGGRRFRGELTDGVILKSKKNMLTRKLMTMLMLVAKFLAMLSA